MLKWFEGVVAKVLKIMQFSYIMKIFYIIKNLAFGGGLGGNITDDVNLLQI